MLTCFEAVILATSKGIVRFSLFNPHLDALVKVAA